MPEPLTIRRMQSSGLSRDVAGFWGDASRIYRNFLNVFADRRRGREALREVHKDMAVRAVYARDYRLLWRIVRSACRPDIPAVGLAAAVAWRLVRNRLGR